MKRLMFFLAIALFAGMSTAGVKYVAVVESDVDESSGASEKISRADVRLVTAEIRREAVKNLPPKKYSVMTSETVIAQGSAVLAECHEENCVISLGSTIGADYIVRGTVSKIETKFSLQVEMYETEDGTLVASCDPVRSESIGELIEKAAEACANMFKTWVASQTATADPGVKKPLNMGISGGGVFATDFGGGVAWASGQIGTPLYGGGAYLAIDLAYAAISVGYLYGGGKWLGPKDADPGNLPDMRRASVNIGVSSKYPKFEMGENIKAYPVLDVGYEIPISGELEYADKTKYVFDGNNKDKYTASALSALWIRIGGGMDFYITPKTYLCAALLYGARTANTFEKDGMNIDNAEKTRLGHGLTVRVGAGFRL